MSLSWYLCSTTSLKGKDIAVGQVQVPSDPEKNLMYIQRFGVN